MTEPEPAESCHVTLLVPHPRRIAVLVADADSSSGTSTSTQTLMPPQPRLPTLRMNNAEPSLAEILASVDVVDTSTVAVLRVVMTSAAEANDGEDHEHAETFMVEFEAASTDPSAGWAWQDLDASVIARLEPATSRAAVASWVRERAEGWSLLRPQWSHPGWFARASSWIVDQMAAARLPVVAAPRQHQLWGISVVLRASSADGDVFFKCSAEAFRHEAVATQALAGMMPELVPEVIAVDGARGWMLMRDLGAAELGDQDESLWFEGVVAHAGIQQLWLGRSEELVALGLPNRSLTDLAAQVGAMTQDSALLGRMPPDLRERWLATAPMLIESCRRLDKIGPGPTLVHGDFHPWNVAFGPATTRVFDWTDAALSHPFVDLATYVFRSQDVSVRQGLVDAYVDAWSTMGSEASLRDAAALGLVVGALYQVQSYRALLPTLIGNGADDGLADADLHWIERSLTRHEQGLNSPV
ncbi:MAG TPA: aminoglycoside phosphotransferase family protein [Kribbella sp.]|nr:aminoglycoside phosphotransferase family protein [Kribbella sp.]